MIRKGVEFSLQLIEPGLWKWQFQIGLAVTSGSTHTNLKGLAIRRAESRIDRALRVRGTVAADVRANRAGEATSSVAGVHGTKTPIKRILVVDDDPLICGAIRAWIEQRGFAVVIANSGEAGLNALECSTFDLMIVDIFMPHMKGFQSVRVFHQRAPTVPLIAISGYVFAEQRMPAPDFLNMALRLGATRCLRKPFTPSTLLSVIDACLLETESRKIKAIV
jgi:CheY-like chemotaxis protein